MSLLKRIGGNTPGVPEQAAVVSRPGAVRPDGSKLGGASREIQQRGSRFGACGNVEVHALVGAVGFVPLCELHRVTDVAKRLELRSLHHAPVFHIEANHKSARHHWTAPFVLNTVPESTSASWSESPSALNAASTT